MRLASSLVLAACTGPALAGCTGPTFDHVPRADADTIAGIERGVLFVDASWSLPSLHARAALERRIADLPIELVIADLDQSPGLAEVPALHDRLTGAGESVWIREGAICLVCTDPACVDDGLARILPPDPFGLVRRAPAAC